MTYHEEREEFVGIMARECPKIKLYRVRDIMRIAQRLQRIAVRECNGHQTFDGKWDEKAAARDERIELRLQSELTRIVKDCGVKPDFQGDPRGAVVKLQVPSGFYNDWGRGGICVPTRE